MIVITGISDVKKSWVGRIKPQPRRMQERAAENWRLFDSASIEWLVASRGGFYLFRTSNQYV
ncbi:hypothetical protein AB5G42_000584 [Salmonella enterica subsp. enterica serovar Teko]|nr:hypothetical protein [Salmonella enterica]EDH9506035.1 hypothetical protein [Salmonella enterica subsp. enterica serovar Newport]EEN9963028.1 hypothetical protein [Salmonella enterica subsp. enterica]HBJ6646569.1 hypothetical protein [Salmonella enterica subsp. enterica serovar Give]EBJ1816286.1 hypothetical protein [Salmonella enterica]